MAWSYANEIERTKEALSKIEPLSEEYRRGLTIITDLRWLARAEETECDVQCFIEKQQFIKDQSEPAPDPEPIKEAELPVEEPTPFPEEPKEEPAKEWSKAEVRERLAELKKAGKDLKELFKQFSASKLSDVKEEDYPALMAKAEEM